MTGKMACQVPSVDCEGTEKGNKGRGGATRDRVPNARASLKAQEESLILPSLHLPPRGAMTGDLSYSV